MAHRRIPTHIETIRAGADALAALRLDEVFPNRDGLRMPLGQFILLDLRYYAQELQRDVERLTRHARFGEMAVQALERADVDSIATLPLVERESLERMERELVADIRENGPVLDDDGVPGAIVGPDGRLELRLYPEAG